VLIVIMLNVVMVSVVAPSKVPHPYISDQAEKAFKGRTL
jgi:hypothetical protein